MLISRGTFWTAATTFVVTGVSIALIPATGPVGPVATVKAAIATATFFGLLNHLREKRDVTAVPATTTVNRYGIWLRIEDFSMGMTDVFKNFDFHRAFTHFGRAFAMDNSQGNKLNNDSARCGFSRSYFLVGSSAVVLALAIVTYMSMSSKASVPPVTININNN